MTPSPTHDCAHRPESARPRALWPALWPSLCLALVPAFALSPSEARAQDVAGSLAAQLLVSDGDVGGGALLDLWAPFDWFRVGGFLGVGVIPSERDAQNRVMMPAGVSIAGSWHTSDVSFSLRARGGVWGGATQASKLTLGGLFGGGMALGWQASATLSINVGVEIWGVLGAGETWCIPLSVGIEWGPAPAPVLETPP